MRIAALRRQHDTHHPLECLAIGLDDTEGCCYGHDAPATGPKNGQQATNHDTDGLQEHTRTIGDCWRVGLRSGGGGYTGAARLQTTPRRQAFIFMKIWIGFVRCASDSAILPLHSPSTTLSSSHEYPRIRTVTRSADQVAIRIGSVRDPDRCTDYGRGFGRSDNRATDRGSIRFAIRGSL
ncbi:hypothetical protein BDZ89DRAFT_1040265 [Hymenopellis radicata]|nr:hypothetical protein BDZ89DRAFT_1040265 [Hymenopellis radicata]